MPRTKCLGDRLESPGMAKPRRSGSGYFLHARGNPVPPKGFEGFRWSSVGIGSMMGAVRGCLDLRSGDWKPLAASRNPFIAKWNPFTRRFAGRESWDSAMGPFCCGGSVLTAAKKLGRRWTDRQETTGRDDRVMWATT
jgi:hypothetical protein